MYKYVRHNTSQKFNFFIEIYYESKHRYWMQRMFQKVSDLMTSVLQCCHHILENKAFYVIWTLEICYHVFSNNILLRILQNFSDNKGKTTSCHVTLQKCWYWRYLSISSINLYSSSKPILIQDDRKVTHIKLKVLTCITDIISPTARW
jgi:hypothetical protein